KLHGEPRVGERELSLLAEPGGGARGGRRIGATKGADGNGDAAHEEAFRDLGEDCGSATDTYLGVPDHLAHRRPQSGHRLAPPRHGRQEGLEVAPRRGALDGDQLGQPLAAAQAPPDVAGGPPPPAAGPPPGGGPPAGETLPPPVP